MGFERGGGNCARAPLVPTVCRAGLRAAEEAALLLA